MDTAFRPLYRLAAAATAFVWATIVLSIAGYLRWPVAAGVTPTAEVLSLTRTNVWAAFIALDLGLSLGNIASLAIVLALYAALRRRNEAWALMALVAGLAAIAALIAARGVLEVFVLGALHAAAETEADRSRTLAAAEAILVQFHGTAWHTYMVLGPVSYAISSWLMLGSPWFGRRVGALGLVTSVVGLLFWLPGIGTIALFASMLGWLAWAPMLALRFLAASRNGARPQPTVAS